MKQRHNQTLSYSFLGTYTITTKKNSFKKVLKKKKNKKFPYNSQLVSRPFNWKDPQKCNHPHSLTQSVSWSGFARRREREERSKFQALSSFALRAVSLYVPLLCSLWRNSAISPREQRSNPPPTLGASFERELSQWPTLVVAPIPVARRAKCYGTRCLSRVGPDQAVGFLTLASLLHISLLPEKLRYHTRSLRPSSYLLGIEVEFYRFFN